MPTTTTVSVVTSGTTTYVSDSGAALSEADFFTALATTPTVNIQGTYDSATTTFTATSIKIVNHALDGGWEHENHNFRPGVNVGNWGHGLFH